jgi:hypothetical protein
LATRNIVTGASMLVALAIAGVALYNTQQKRERAATPPPKTTADTTHAVAPPAATPVESLPAAGRGILVKPDSAKKPAAKDSSAFDTAPLIRIARSMRSANMDSVERAFPNPIPAAHRAYLEGVFKGYDILKSEPLLHGATITGSHAEMPFGIRVTYSVHNTGVGTSLVLDYQALYDLREGKWVLTSVRPAK